MVFKSLVGAFVWFVGVSVAQDNVTIKYLPYTTSNGTVCSTSWGCWSFVHIVVSATASRLNGGARWGSSRDYEEVDDNLRSESHQVTGDCSDSSNASSCSYYDEPAHMYSWGWAAFNSSRDTLCAELWFGNGATIELPCFDLTTSTATQNDTSWSTSFNDFPTAVTSTCSGATCETHAHVVFTVSPPLDVLNKVTGALEYSWDNGTTWRSDRTRTFYEDHLSLSNGRWYQAWQADLAAPGAAAASTLCFRVSLVDSWLGSLTWLETASAVLRREDLEPPAYRCLPVATSLQPFHWPWGHGIAQSAASAGYSVIGVDSNADVLAKGRANIEKSVSKLSEKLVKKGELSSEAAAARASETMSRLLFADSTAAVADADIVVEAIVENMDIKLKFYESLGKTVKDSAIFASNTSSLRITPMAIASKRPSQFIGLHYFNPVQLMKLCEVVKTDHTDPAVFALARDFAQRCGKTTVDCVDSPGFVVNRLLVPSIANAIALAERGDATIPDIDLAMKLGAGHPMGPITLADYVGLDTTLSILRGWVTDYPDEPTFFVPKALEAKVAAGKLGRKSGEGFYVWGGGVASTQPTGLSGLE
ncbi:hypothetical protein CTAYLR_006863 [Chrysophaeum taylorii]|uniref:3-hydroxyacyl-CoA dehydrogenase n=1 Tax=Chrysophaeum taylorii TaxID=2483200 RepID=A0AAD7U500_9STRA|nr:hypothetical protein CTAYLR_006863 [Chrysophaeum taylorii]